jgi:diamine N-acetyltransferase
MITIRHARLNEKKKSYEWLCLSDTAEMHMREPNYTESPIPDWDQFDQDFEDFYYSESSQDKGSVMIIEKDNIELGCLCYACFHLKPNRAELDIWLKSKEYCGYGFGTAALKLLVEYLREEKNTFNFIIRPSEKNVRAIRSYEKTGFVKVKNKEQTIKEYLLDKYIVEYGDGDYGFEDTAILVLE